MPCFIKPISGNRHAGGRIGSWHMNKTIHTLGSRGGKQTKDCSQTWCFGFQFRLGSIFQMNVDFQFRVLFFFPQSMPVLLWVCHTVCLVDIRLCSRSFSDPCAPIWRHSDVLWDQELFLMFGNSLSFCSLLHVLIFFTHYLQSDFSNRTMFPVTVPWHARFVLFVFC